MPTIPIRWSDNTKELTERLKAGTQTIEATRAAAEKMAKSLGGDNLIRAAHNMAAAIGEIANVSKLTQAEQGRVNTLMEKAIEKYRLLGKEAPQAMRDIAAATRQVEEPSQRLDGWLGSLSSHILATTAGFISAQAILGAVGTGVRALSGFVADSVKSYAAAETAQVKLTAALRAQGTATPQTIAAYNDLATQFQHTTVYSDDLINSMQGLLVEVGNVMPAQMKGALQASADLASGLGIDLETATTLVAKAASGHTETLGRYGITVDQAALKTEGFDAVLQAINRQFGGQAAAQVDTYAGSIQKMANAWDNVKEAVGKAIVTDPLVTNLLGKVADAADAADSSISGTSLALVNLSKYVDDVLPGIGGLIRKYELLAIAQNALKHPPQDIVLTAQPFKDFGPELPQDFYLQKAKEREEAQKKINEALAKYRETVASVIAIHDTYQQTIDTIDGSVAEGIKYYLQRGASVHDLAVMYGLLDTQVEAVKQQMTAEAELAKKLAAVENVAAGNLKNFGDIGQQVSVKARTLAEDLEFLQRRGDFVAATFLKMGGAFSASVKDIDIFGSFDTLGSTQLAQIGELVNGPSGLSAIPAKAEKATSSISILAQAFSQLGNIGDGALGGIVRGIGSLISGIDVATKAVDQMSSHVDDAGKTIQASFANQVAGAASLFGLMLQLRDLADQITPGFALINTASTVSTFLNTLGPDALGKITEMYLASGRTARDAQVDYANLIAAIHQGGDAAAEAIKKMQAAMAEGQEIIDAMHAGGAHSNTELQHAADVARKAFEEALASGDFNQENLDKLYLAYQQALANAGNEAAKAWLKAHDAAEHAADAGTEAMKSAEANLKALIDKRDALAKGVAAEAWEPVMGETEKADRAAIASLDEQIQRQAEQLAQLAKDTGQEMADSIKEALERLHINIDVGYNLPNPPPGGYGGYTPGRYNPGDIGESAASTGGYVRNWGIEHFAMGGLVSPRGTDTVPAMLTPGEVVLTAAQQRDLATGLTGRNTSVRYDVTINAVDAASFEELLRREGGKTFIRLLDQNRNGIRTETQELLGVR